MEITNTGLKIVGDWEEICSFSRRVSKIIKEYSEKKKTSDMKSAEEFDEWRPREEEDKDDLKKKTVEKASLKEKKVEKDFEGAKKEFSKATEKMEESVKEAVNGEDPGNNLKEASEGIGKIIEAESFKSIRKMEEAIFEKIMLNFSPYYFDTEKLSINLKRNKKEKEYVLTVNVLDEELKKYMQDKVKEK